MIAFAAGGDAVERGAELRDDPAAQARLWREAGRALVIDTDGRVAVDADGAPIFVGADDPGAAATAPPLWLGWAGAGAWFAVRAEALPAEAALRIARRVDLRALLPTLDGATGSLLATARALFHWQARSRFCGVCGTETAIEAAGHRARCRSVDCGTQFFPRTDAAIIVLITCGRRCLLGRQPSWPERRYSTIAGFVEPGETLEDAVRREVFEESGVRVGEVEYLMSQPWPFPASLMLGFEGSAASDVIRIGEELADARFVDADALLEGTASGDIVLSPPQSISYALIARWCERLTGRRPLPGPLFMARG